MVKEEKRKVTYVHRMNINENDVFSSSSSSESQFHFRVNSTVYSVWCVHQRPFGTRNTLTCSFEKNIQRCVSFNSTLLLRSNVIRRRTNAQETLRTITYRYWQRKGEHMFEFSCDFFLKYELTDMWKRDTWIEVCDLKEKVHTSHKKLFTSNMSDVIVRQSNEYYHCDWHVRLFCVYHVGECPSKMSKKLISLILNKLKSCSMKKTLISWKSHWKTRLSLL